MDGSSFFVLPKIKTERMNRMKNKPSLWNSVSVLVVAVLIVTAFIRGMAQIWLYAAVFAAWAVWVRLRLFPSSSYRVGTPPFDASYPVIPSTEAIF